DSVEEARRVTRRLLSGELEPPPEFLGLRSGAVNEVLAVTEGPAGRNVAPVGLRLFDGTPRVVLYRGSRTRRNFEASGRLVACVNPDPIDFLRALFDELPVRRWKGVPVAEGTRAFLTLEGVRTSEERGALRAELRVSDWGLLHPRPRALVRGEGAMLEALVAFTRLHLGEEHERRCREALETVRRTVRSRRYLRAVERLEERLGSRP
ncbi:MAG: DUF447 domain-containing protein, partial [Euryarchaeota archaeon]